MYKRLTIVLVGILILSFAAGCKNKDQSAAQAKQKSMLEMTTVLGAMSESESSYLEAQSSDRSMGHKLVLSPLGLGVAYQAPVDGGVRVIHNGKPGNVYKNIDYLVITDDGQQIAYGAEVDGKWRMIVNGTAGMFFDTVGMPRFSPDGRHVLYDASIDEKWHLVVDGKISEKKSGFYDKSFSSDSKRIYSIDNPDDDSSPRKMVVRDLSLNKLSERELFTHHAIYNSNMSKVAMITRENNLSRLVVFDYDNPEKIYYGPLFSDIGLESFGPDGETVAYLAEKNGKMFVAFNDNAEQIPTGEVKQPPVIRPDKLEVGLIIKSNGKAFFHRAFEKSKTSTKKYDEAANIVYSKDSKHYAYTARVDKDVFMVINGLETPVFDMIIDPIFSPDGRLLVFRARKDGKRFVVAADNKGKIVYQSEKFDMVFKPVFTPDSKSIAFGVKNGTQLIWKCDKFEQ